MPFRDTAHAARGRLLLAEAQTDRDRQEVPPARAIGGNRRVPGANNEARTARPHLKRDRSTAAEPELRLRGGAQGSVVELHIVKADPRVQQDPRGSTRRIERIYHRGHTT